eukprot:4014014-Pyramimonas_sp.AAC.1
MYPRAAPITQTFLNSSVYDLGRFGARISMYFQAQATMHGRGLSTLSAKDLLIHNSHLVDAVPEERDPAQRTMCYGGCPVNLYSRCSTTLHENSRRA